MEVIIPISTSCGVIHWTYLLMNGNTIQSLSKSALSAYDRKEDVLIVSSSNVQKEHLSSAVKPNLYNFVLL